MPHLDDGVLHAMVDGEIPSAELVAVQAHLAGCESCRGRLAEAQAFAAEARVLVERVELPTAGRQGGRAAGQPGGKTAGRQGGRAAGRRLAWAASVVLAVGLGYQTGRWSDGQTVGRSDGQTVGRSDGQTGGEVVAVAPTPADRPAVSNEVRAKETPAQPSVLPPEPVVTADAAAGRVVAEPSAPAAAVQLQARSGIERRELAARQGVEGGLIEPIEFPAAVALLGGRLRLIEGLAPERLERAGPVVRVVYPGPVFLEQRRAGDSVAVRLFAPGVSADSVARLLAKVR